MARFCVSSSASSPLVCAKIYTSIDARRAAVYSALLSVAVTA
jgi:hypothetical protein